MQEVGTVVGLIDGRAQVGLTDAQGCHRCGGCSRIGDHMVLEVPLEGESVSIGDQVLVDVPAQASFAGAALVYVVPLAGFLLGAGAGALITGSASLDSSYPNLLPVLLATVGLAGGFLLAWWFDRRRLRGAHEKLRIVHRL